MQTLTVPAFDPSNTGSFTLQFTFDGATDTTGPLNLNSPTLAADIQNALNGLKTIGGLTANGLAPVPGSVTVTQAALVDNVSMSVAAVRVNAGTATVTTTANVTLLVGDYVTLAGLTNAQLDGTYLITAVAGQTFQFATTAANLGFTADSGTATGVINPNAFNITFGGALSGIQLPLLVAAGVGTTPNPSVTGPTGAGNTGSTATMSLGAIAVDPNDPRIVYVGTGEADNSSDSFAGSGVYKSTDAGQTWSLLTASDGTNPLFGLAVSKIVVDPGAPPAQPWTGPQPTWPNGELPFQTGQLPTGTIYVATSGNVANEPVHPPAGVVNPQPGVYRFNSATTQVQTITLPTNTGTGTFTLSWTYTDPVTKVTGMDSGTYSFSDPTLAADIAADMNTNWLKTVVASGGKVVVTQSISNPLVFTITFEGGLVPPVPPRLPNPPNTFQGPPPPPVLLMTATSTGASAVTVTASSTWVNLTLTPTVARTQQTGQLGRIPGTAGPDDDFRMSFDEGQTSVWSDLALTYLDVSNPAYLNTDDFPGQALPGGMRDDTGYFVPVLYAALGDPGGNGNNAVYRSEVPNLAPATDHPTQWYVGDPGVLQDEIWQVTVKQSGGNYQLQWTNGAGTASLWPGGTGSTAWNTSTATVSAGLNGMTAIKGIGGKVVVTPVPALTNSTQFVYNVEFEGTLINSPQPSFVAISGSVSFTEIQKGSGIDTRAGEFPTPTNGGSSTNNGNIKFGLFTTPNVNLNVNADPDLDVVPIYSNVTVFAAVANPSNGSLLTIEFSKTGGKSWGPVPLASGTNYLGTKGFYANAIVATSANSFIVAGMQSNLATHLGMILEDPSIGGALQDISVGVANAVGPHTDAHALAVDAAGRVLIGTDGGIWQSNANPTLATIAWTDLNGNLPTLNLNSAAGNPNDINSALAGSQENGVEVTSGSAAWSEVIPPGNAGLTSGGEVRYDPLNPSIAYAVTSAPSGNFVLNKSTVGGASGSWAPLSLNPGVASLFPFLVDPVSDQRLLAGGAALQESLDGGTTWKNVLNAPGGVTALAAATYQGNFVADGGFPLVTDTGANTYDPNTIYEVVSFSGFFQVWVTKNHGQTWQNRTSTLPLFNPLVQATTMPITAIQVDPANRDTVYVTSNLFGTDKVFRSTNAGRVFSDINFNLPDVPTWTLAVDPRTDSPTVLGQATVYVGTDDGVWLLPSGSSTWQRFDSGMPEVSVRDLQLNQSANTLTAATYGRSVFRFYLSPPPPVGTPTGAAQTYGALRAVSGSSVWAGPVILVGDAANEVTLNADGTQALQNGFSTAQVNILGTISDALPDTNPTLNKVGNGNVVLSGANTYGGVTQIQQGVLVANNPQALGASGPAADTIVNPGTALELQADLALETVHLNGDGILFNNHNTGALRNVSNNNTFTGTIVLDTASTIGVDTGSSLTVGIKNGLPGTGTITDGTTPGLSLTKELTGTLSLNSANTYTGTTVVNQGAIQVQNPQALGGTANGTEVKDGGQLQIQNPSIGPLAGQPVVVSGEKLTLSGTGIFGTGALLDTGGNNTWAGNIFLADNPVFLLPGGTVAATTPPPEVALGVTNAADTLTISGVISQEAPLTRPADNPLQLWKVGLGRVTLTQTDTYAGVTTVFAGALRVQNAHALSGSSTVVNPFAAVELDGDPTNVGASLTMTEPVTISGYGPSAVQLISVVGASGLFKLTYGGAQTNSLSVTSPTLATDIQAALNSLPSVLNVGGFVTVTPTAGGFLVTFGGGLATVPVGVMTSNQPGLATVSVIVGGGQGALRNFSGNNTYHGAITLAADTAIGVDPGTQLLVANPGVVQDPSPAPVPAASLSKVGAGTLVFASANTYSGETFVNNGVLNVRNAGALGTSAPETQQITVLGANGTFTLQFNGFTTSAPPTLDVNNASTTLAADIQAALNALPSIGGVGGSVTVTQVPGNNIYKVVFGGTLAQVNVPQIQVGAQSPSLSIGILTLNDGPDITQVNSGGTLQVQGNLTFPNELLTLNGTGFNNLGALENLSGFSDTWDRAVTLGSNATIAVDGNADRLTIDQMIGDGGGGFGVTKIGPGTLIYSGSASNTYTGLTQVNGGVLQLGKAAPSAVQDVYVYGLLGQQFTLSFNGATTSPALGVGAPATGAGSVQGALQGLFTIGSGNVAVNLINSVAATASTPGWYLYQVTFTGALAQSAQPPITIAPASGNVSNEVQTLTVVKGLAADTFQLLFNGTPTANLTVGTLTANAIQTKLSPLLPAGGTVNVTGPTLTAPVNGAGTISSSGTAVTGVGTTFTTAVAVGDLLGNAASGFFKVTAITSDTQLTLASTPAIPFGAGSAYQIEHNVYTLTFGGTLAGVNVTQLTTGGTNPTDAAVGTVQDGGVKVVVTTQTAGAPVGTAVAGNLTIGNPPPNSGTPVVQLVASNQIADTVTVTVNPNGLLDLNGHAETLGNVVMTGGLVTLGGGQLNLAGPVTATADPSNNPATVSGAGAVTLNGAAQTFTVNPGVNNPTGAVPDMVISSVIGSTAGDALTKAGAGVLKLTGAETYAGTTTVNNGLLLVTGSYGGATQLNGGTLQADGTVGAVTLAGGTLTGTGSTGALTSAAPTPPSTASNVTPGDTPPGQETVVGSVTWNAATNFNVVVSAGTPDGLIVNGGTVTINGATLTGTLAAGTSPNIGDSYTVLTVTNGGSIASGSVFATPAVFIGGMKFSIVIGNTTVVLQRVPMNTTTALSAATPSSPVTFGTAVTFTAAVTPEMTPKAGDNLTGTVTFYDGTPGPGTALGLPQAAAAPGVYTFTTSTTQLAVGNHIINAVYNGDPLFNGSQSQPVFPFRVNLAPTVTTLSANPPSPPPGAVNFGTAVAFTVQVTPSPFFTGAEPSDTVTLKDGFNTVATLNLMDVGGTATATYTTTSTQLSAATHSFTATYNGDGSFKLGTSNPNLTYVVNPAPTTTTLTLPSSTTFGTAVTLTAAVAPVQAGLTPTGSVSFFDGATSLGSGTLSGGLASYVTGATQLGGGSHANITAVYVPNDSNYAASTSAPGSVTVSQAGTTTTITAASPSSTVTFGTAVAFTATVTPAQNGVLPTGTVTFYDNGTSIGTGSLRSFAGQATAFFTAPLLGGGSHPITAVYGSDANYSGGTPSATFTVTVNTQGPATAIASSVPSPQAFGTAVTFTVQVTPVLGTTLPTGTVTFFDGTTSLGSGGLLNMSGVATATFSPSASQLQGGGHQINASYGGDTNYSSAATQNFAFTVLPATTSTAFATAAATTFGTPITFTATITVVQGGVQPTGTVIFKDGGASIAQAPLSGSSNVVTFVTPPTLLSVGTPHSLSAVYGGDANANYASSFSAASPVTVTRAPTTAGVTIAAPVSAPFGTAATFTATVTPTFAPILPTGTVTFFDGGASLGTVSVANAANTAVFITGQTQLAFGSHSITAVYNGDGNFAASSPSAVQTYTVTKAGTTTTITGTTPASPGFGTPVTFTATVTPFLGGVLPTGTVTFTEGATTLGTGTVANVGGTATATITTGATDLARGGHSITATFNPDVPDVNYAGSTSASFALTVTKPTVAVAVSAFPASSTFGTAVTFTATVTPAFFVGTAPGGTLTFFDGAVSLGTGTLAAGGQAATATFTTGLTQLPGGTRAITAAFAGDTNYAPSTSAVLSYAVSAFPATVTVTKASPASPSTFGTAVTLTATVTPSVNGVDPQGTVTFFDGTTSIGTGTLADVAGVATATYTTAATQLGVGPHAITAAFAAGDGNYAAPKSAAFGYTVGFASATPVITAATPSTPPTFGTPVTFTATVTGSVGGVLPTGKLTFLDGVTTLGSSGNLASVGGTATALFTTGATQLTAGNHTITAFYVGDANYASNTSAGFAYTVNRLPTTTTITSATPNGSAPPFGTPVTFTATVTPGFGGSVPTGTLTFLDGTSTLGTSGLLANLGGTATVTFTTGAAALSAGPHTITAVYNGDSEFANSPASAGFGYGVAQRASTVTLTGASRTSPATFGDPVTFTAQVTPGFGTALPTGTVTFFDGGTSLGTGTLAGFNGTATATFSPTPALLQVGGHTITAGYGGDTNYLAGGPSAGFSFTVTRAPSTPVVTATTPAGPVSYGTAVAITATVTPTFGTVSPTGSLTFFDGGTSLGTGSLSGGTATFTTAATQLAVGGHTLTAVYAGDTNFVGATSAGFALTVKGASTTTTVTGALPTGSPPPTFGTVVTFTAQVAGFVSGVTPTGTLTFLDGSATLGTGALSGSGGTATATYTTSASQLGGGGHTITAVYGGDAKYAASTSGNFAYTVAKNAGTAAAVTAATPANSANFGTPVTFTATITPVIGSVLPTGSVTFLDGATTLAANVPVVNAGGAAVAVYTTTQTQLGVSTHTISVVYGGDANFVGATSGGFSYAVVRATTTAAVIAATPNPSGLGAAVTLTAQVTPSFGGTIPTGTLAFVDGTTTLGTGSLAAVGGVATATYTTSATQLGGGTNSLTVVYGGDGNFAGTTSAAFTQTVNRAGSQTTVASIVPNSPTYGVDHVTITAHVTGPVAGFSPTPGTGVTFLDGATTLGTGTIDAGGNAALTTATTQLGGGTHNSITAVWAGDADYTGSTSAAGSVTVNKATDTVTVGTSGSPAGYGQATITVTVAPAAGSGTPGGSVTFKVNGNPVETDSLGAGGTVTLSTAQVLQALPPSATAYTITATYSGDGNFVANTTSNSVSQTIVKANTSTLVTSSSAGNTSTFGQAVTFTAVISPAGAGTPTGTVTFMDNGKTFSGGAGVNVPVQTVGGQQVAMFTIANLVVSSVTSHSITAAYTGDANFNGSASSGLTQTVNPAATSTTVTSSSPTATYGQSNPPVTFLATVTVVNPGPGSGLLGGTVNFYDGPVANGVLLGSSPVITTGQGQQAGYTLNPATQLGAQATPHTITAQYVDTTGDGSFSSSTGTVSQQVNRATPSVTVAYATTTNPIVNKVVTYTVTVSSPLGTPTGSVTFSATQGSSAVTIVKPVQTLVGGKATVAITLPAAGSITVTANYGGDTNFGPTSGAFVQTVFTPSQAFVNQVYLDLLNRPADPAALAGWGNAVDTNFFNPNPVLNRNIIVQYIETSREYRQDEVDALYVHYLRRHADPTGLANFTNYLMAGGTVETVASLLVGSLEYFQNTGNYYPPGTGQGVVGNSVDGWVRAMYLDVLGRPVDPQGEQSFTQALAFNVSRQQCAAILLGSQEYKQDVVTKVYSQYLGHPPDPVGLAGWTSGLMNGMTDEQLVAGIMGSQEFFNNL